MTICGTCGEEVRHGVRHGRTGWWHRGDVNHEATLGRFMRPEEWREMMARIQQHDEAEEADAEPEGIPEPEVLCHPIAADDLKPRSGIRQIYNLMVKSGWEVRRLTHARGPYVGASGKVLSISDSIVLGGRGPEQLDGTRRLAVASWRDGAFDFALVGVGRQMSRVTSTALKQWIKGAE